jgi:protoporphyrin/coproporphyrin ferrochelatase
MNRTGVLLINLGTPDAPTPEAVGRYLREFLMDGLVIDTPAPLRWFLVNVLIVPRRKYQSAEAYQKVQLPGGSPLLVHTRALAQKVAGELGDDYLVEFAMRYGNPSIQVALAKLRDQVERIIVLPLYPQYAESSFETAVVETKRSAAELGCDDRLMFMPPFYDRAEFINAFASRISQSLAIHNSEHVVFSFHSLPERHVTKLHPQHCLRSANCCEQINAANQSCYRAQCFSTTRAIVQQLGLKDESYIVSFQSRLGRAKWIGPATEQVLKDLAHQGKKRISVACPSFVADCLETVEEIAIRGRETFIAAGGTDLQLIPSLNDDPVWVAAVAGMVREAGKREAIAC